MNIRRLEKSEHNLTRKLWEEVFSEDTKAFLDYYYYIKAKDNEIYVIEEDNEIVSMLHLNPYKLLIQEQQHPSFYIVAVATNKEYRSRGFMRELLCRSLEEMYEGKVPFTFLMPAAEQIYSPYDFRFIYEQNTAELDEETLERMISLETHEGTCDNTDAGLWDAEELSQFFEQVDEPNWQVQAKHDTSYYQTMILEQQSEKGGVRLIREDGVLKGFFAYAFEEGLEVREPVYLPEYETDFLRALMELNAQLQHRLPGEAKKQIVKLSGITDTLSDSRKKLIMARIVHLQTFLQCLQKKEEDELSCSFAVIDPILQNNSRVWKLSGKPGETEIHVSETEDSQGVIGIADLTEYLFGRITLNELQTREGVYLSEDLKKELKKIVKLKKTEFNEIV